MTERSNTKQWLIFITLYAVTTLNFIGMSLFSPLINRQLRILDIHPVSLGIVGSTYGICQLLSSPFIGYGSHKYGLNFIYILSLLGTLLNNFVQAFTSSLSIFVLARSLAGFLKHSSVLEKLLLTKLAKRNEIAWGLGYLGAFSNLGVVIGPSITAYFLQFENGPHLIPTIATGIYTLIIILVAKLLWDTKAEQYSKTNKLNANADSAQNVEMLYNGKIPSSITSDSINSRIIKNKSNQKSISSSSSILNIIPKFKKLKSTLQNESQLVFVLLLKFCFVFASHCIRSNFPLILQRKYSASESFIGYLNSIQSTIGMLIGFTVSPIIYYFYGNNQRNIILHAGFLQMISFICQIIAPTLGWACIAILLLEMANPFLWVSTVALALNINYPSQNNNNNSGDDDGYQSYHQFSTGTIISLSVMMSNISLMTAPFCSGLVVLPQWKYIDHNGPALLAALFSFIGICITFLCVPSTTGDKSTNGSRCNKPLLNNNYK